MDLLFSRNQISSRAAPYYGADDDDEEETVVPISS